MDSVLTDRQFMIILTFAAIFVIGGLWAAMIPTLHDIRRAARSLIARTELLEEHIRATTPEVLDNIEKK